MLSVVYSLTNEFETEVSTILSSIVIRRLFHVRCLAVRDPVKHRIHFWFDPSHLPKGTAANYDAHCRKLLTVNHKLIHTTPGGCFGLRSTLRKKVEFYLNESFDFGNRRLIQYELVWHFFQHYRRAMSFHDYLFPKMNLVLICPTC
jgi:hypothetical protein